MTNPTRAKNGKASLHGSFDRKRLGVILAALFGVCVMPATGASAAGCEPGPEEVSFFQHGNYKGSCSVLGRGRYENSKELRLNNDSISSFKVGSKVNVIVCKHATKSRYVKNPQRCQLHRSSRPSLKGQKVGNDSISSARVIAPIHDFARRTNGKCKPEDGKAAVTVYDKANYRGNCRILTLGSYKDSKAMNFKNDSIISIEFGNNTKARIKICQHKNFKGRCDTLNNSVSSLEFNNVQRKEITSIQVMRK